MPSVMASLTLRSWMRRFFEFFGKIGTVAYVGSAIEVSKKTDELDEVALCGIRGRVTVTEKLRARVGGRMGGRLVG